MVEIGRHMRHFLKLAILILLCASASHAQWGPWPGQSGNPVGYAAAPGWPGSFTGTACPSSPGSGSSWATAVVISNCTYSGTKNVTCNFCIFEYVDFAGGTGTGNWNLNGNNELYLGDRFQSNETGATNISPGGANVYLFYISGTPLASLTVSPPGSLWPSAGAGTNSVVMTSGVNSTPAANAYQFGITPQNGSGPLFVDHADIWGFGNGIDFADTTAQTTITNSWVHDARYFGTFSDHTDGVGWLNGVSTPAPSNILFQGNTVSTLGTTQDLALQQASSGYVGIFISENYFSGDGTTIAFCQPGSVPCTNSKFYGNVYGTDVAPGTGTTIGNPIYSPGGGVGSGSVWGCNSINVRSGTTWTSTTGWTPTSGMTGQFFLNADPPNSTTDQGGNTACAITNPASYNFGFQGSGGSSAPQTVTLTNTNSASLTVSSVVMASTGTATGTNFAVVSNGCTSVASGANCAITVKFAPTAQGPLTDTLQINDNTPGVTSPQQVPLLGIGTSAPASVGTPTFSPVAGTYGSTQTVSLSTTTSGATICYTTDGTIPTESGNVCLGGTTQTYTTGLTVSSNQTIKALGTKSGLTDSSVASATYVIGIVPVAPSQLMLEVN